MCITEEEEHLIVLDRHDYNEMQEELYRLRTENAELRRDVAHLHDALRDIIHGRKMYPRRCSC